MTAGLWEEEKQQEDIQGGSILFSHAPSFPPHPNPSLPCAFLDPGRWQESKTEVLFIILIWLLNALCVAGFQIWDLTRRICGVLGDPRQGPVADMFPIGDSELFSCPVTANTMLSLSALLQQAALWDRGHLVHKNCSEVQVDKLTPYPSPCSQGQLYWAFCPRSFPEEKQRSVIITLCSKLWGPQCQFLSRKCSHSAKVEAWEKPLVSAVFQASSQWAEKPIHHSIGNANFYKQCFQVPQHLTGGWGKHLSSLPVKKEKNATMLSTPMNSLQKALNEPQRQRTGLVVWTTFSNSCRAVSGPSLKCGGNFHPMSSTLRSQILRQQKISQSVCCYKGRATFEWGSFNESLSFWIATQLPWKEKLK